MEKETNRKTTPVPRMQDQVDLTSLISLKDNKERGTVRLISTPDYQGTPSPVEQGQLSKVEDDALLYAETYQVAKSKISLGRSPVSQLVGKPRTYSEAPPVVR